MEKTVKGVKRTSKDQALLLIKGIILGIGIIIPGMSGGTILVIFGIYERLIKDILELHFKPYLTMGFGVVIGVFMGGTILSYLFQVYRDPTYTFILGCLLMSIPFVLKRSNGNSVVNLLLLIFGGVVSLSLVSMPPLMEGGSLSIGNTFLAGFISSSTMMIPGISGSAVLIVLGIYEEMLLLIKEIQIANLLIFVIGAFFGVFILAKVLNTLFSKYQSQILYFFSGLILGSSRLLFPSEIGVLTIITFILGGAIVFKWGNFKYK
ncbi:DUF368 domain-containing protein [Alkaliphilus peptidifermentans]|uniref:Putative membrane protein n=1 Tax=Alkaliphilus peptidifermentans DSM 18978 TaxID=1120976 RepID=A0A1G5AFF1_9FIRM|nr:DUF368 domain-containing protein [Alkaliphilus peptidifermentans]SCX76595.1 putative membrane protein [Alkaliphilus peptidifermentans DSM 18978]